MRKSAKPWLLRKSRLPARTEREFGTTLVATAQRAYPVRSWLHSALTIRSSRRRFAARLNSGVRALQKLLTQLRRAKRRCNSPAGSSAGFLAVGAGFANRFVPASVSGCARGFSRQQTLQHSRPLQRFLAAASGCAQAARLSDGTGNCVWPPCVRSRAPLASFSATLRPNCSSKPTPLRGAA